VVRPDKVVGRNTLECMRSGAYWGYVSLLEGVCARIRAERGGSMKVIATGGLSSLFAKSTEII
jgi:type III pantothenate kinase